MKFATVIVIMVMNSVALAATNMPVAVCSPTTNAVPTKVTQKASGAARPQCEATTLSGNRCKRHAAQGSHYCSQHAAIARRRDKEAKR